MVHHGDLVVDHSCTATFHYGILGAMLPGFDYVFWKWGLSCKF